VLRGLQDESNRGDLFGVGGRNAARLGGPRGPPSSSTSDELGRRAMGRAFAVWASDHAEGSLLRAWGMWNRCFTFLVGDGALLRNPMSAVPKPKLPQTAPRSIRHENPAELLLRTAASPDADAKASKRWPECDVALVATFYATGIRSPKRSARTSTRSPDRTAPAGYKSPTRQQGPRDPDRARTRDGSLTATSSRAASDTAPTRSRTRTRRCMSTTTACG